MRERLDGLYMLLLGSLVFILLGGVLEKVAPAPMSDFKAIYYGARCVFEHRDPYSAGEILRAYQVDGGQFPTDPDIARPARRAISVCINLPTSLFLVAPLALIPFGSSHVLWMILTAGILNVAAYLMWDLSCDYAPVLSGFMIGFVLANSEVLVIIGNAAGIVIGLSLIAVWCFIKRRFAALGVLCLAVSLAFKPHVAGLVWLYFLLAGGLFRRRALQSLAFVVVICLPAIFWVSQVSPHWAQELHFNLAETSARGDLNDPGPSSMGAHTLGMVISLQTLISLFRDEPSFYNAATYLLTAPLILMWIISTLRKRIFIRENLLALAAISMLSLLPVYHRIYDAKLLMLSVPGCVMLWAEGRRIGRVAVIGTAAALILTSDLPWVVVYCLIRPIHRMMPWLSSTLLTDMIVFPGPAVLLAMGAFYTWVYAKRSETAATS